MKAVFIDANAPMVEIACRLHKAGEFDLVVHDNPDIKSEAIPGALDGAPIAIIDHTYLPTDLAQRCAGLKHVVFLGTGARSYMDPDALAQLGITVHTIKGYGDTAVAECAFALMWASARELAKMDRGMRAGRWLRTEGMQLTGKTLGLVGFGGIAAEMARLALGAGMKVVAWNRTPKTHPGVTFTSLEDVLAQSHVVSLHLLLNDETRGMFSSARIAQMRDGVILVNTARAALVDQQALLAALSSGKIRHAGLDVFDIEPVPADHPLLNVENVTLSSHSAFRTPEASDNLIEAALAHCRRIVARGK